MVTRLATAEDIEGLRTVDEQSAPVDARDGVEYRVLDQPGLIESFLAQGGILVAVEDGRVVGYLLSHLVHWMHGIPKLVWLEHIGVHPSYRRRGIALGLLEAASRRYQGTATCMHATIHPNNTASLRLVERFKAVTTERVLAYVDLSSPTRG
jgi:ribosomal protein S18 acetylase RimI-like enzyme